jgi:hypothetical protein
MRTRWLVELFFAAGFWGERQENGRFIPLEDQRDDAGPVNDAAVASPVGEASSQKWQKGVSSHRAFCGGGEGEGGGVVIIIVIVVVSNDTKRKFAQSGQNNSCSSFCKRPDRRCSS